VLSNRVMPLKQSSLTDFFSTITRKAWLVGLGKFRKGNPANSKTHHGAFLFGPPSQASQQIAPTTTPASTDPTPRSNNQKQKRKVETEESEQEQEQEVKRVKISKPDASNDLADDAGEAVYEPQLKRRKLSSSGGLSTGIYAGNSPVSEVNGFADDEEDNTGSECEGPFNDGPNTTDLLTAEAPIDTDSDEESFAPEASDRTGTDGGNWSPNNNDVSTLNWAPSATLQPIPPITPPTLPSTGINMNFYLPRLAPTPRTSPRR
jgi:hypothetical protein